MHFYKTQKTNQSKKVAEPYFLFINLIKHLVAPRGASLFLRTQANFDLGCLPTAQQIISPLETEQVLYVQ